MGDYLVICLLLVVPSASAVTREIIKARGMSNSDIYSNKISLPKHRAEHGTKLVSS